MRPSIAVRIAAVIILTAGVAAFDIVTGTHVDASFFYFLPIALACNWFDTWGVLTIPVIAVLYHRIEVLENPGFHAHRAAADLVRLLSFSLIAGLTLLARTRYEQILQARRVQETLRRAAEARGKRLEALYRVATAANSSRAADQFLNRFLEEAGRLLPQVWAATVLEREDSHLVRRAVFGALPDEAVGQRLEIGQGIAGRVLASGTPLVVHQPDLGPDDIASPLIRGIQPTSVAAVPLVLQDEPVGALVIFGGPEAQFTEDDVRLLQSMASEAALVLRSLRLLESLRRTNELLSERQRRLDEQLRLAREVQQAILSVSPSRSREGPFELASYHASAWEVGGDFLRVLPQERGVAFFLGDVMGKGVPAALLMTMMTAALSASTAHPEDAGAVLEEANRILLMSLAALEWGNFVTVFYAYINQDDLSMCYAGAGHPPPLLVHADGALEKLLAQGIPLGIAADAVCVGTRRGLRPGDRLVLYTDGVTEARNPAGEEFGVERLEGLVVARRGASAEELQEAVVSAVEEYAGNAGAPLDDVAVLVLAVEAQALTPQAAMAATSVSANSQ